MPKGIASKRHTGERSGATSKPLDSLRFQIIGDEFYKMTASYHPSYELTLNKQPEKNESE